MAVTFEDCNSVAGLKKLDEYLLSRSYITGYQASKDDLTVHAAFSKPPSPDYVNVSRWYKHIEELLRISGVSGEGSGVIIEGATPVAIPPAADSKASAAEDDDDDDVDLFGEETEEEKKAAEERAAAVKASSKKKESGKSSVLLDVKPWDDETDMKKLEEAVRSVQLEGLHWGASKLVPVGYGIKKLQIMMTIVDDLVSVDNLIEDHLTAEPINEHVQSVDIVAFNKILTSTESHTTCDDNVSAGPKSIFILAGQSNMAGRGGVSKKVWNGVVPPECQPNPRILRLNAGLSWEEARDPLHHDIDYKTCGVGPGMSFANSVLATDPSIGVIGLVPCAVGGTKISQWRPNDYLYNNTLSRAQAALREGGGQIRAILWFQGESDTVDKADADAYKTRWETLFTQLRSDLQLPNLPVIEVLIESADRKAGEVGKYLKEVRESQMAIGLPNVKYVDSMGLELSGDNVHLSTVGEVQVGKMLADAFLRFF